MVLSVSDHPLPEEEDLERRIPPVGRMNFQADETGFSASPELVESEHTPESNFDELFSSMEKLDRFHFCEI